MSRFIKLSKQIINTRYIENIIISTEPNKYYIQIQDFNSFGFIIHGTGWLNGGSRCKEIIICEKSNPLDYKIVDEWVKKLD